mmetsp:Transcript_46494/g.83114  ORF Transcript_46494/g.83114 Transcript_46494/m.83114 type:complete len:243 (-) Transcript_46494:2838-3566(-)
MPPGKHALFPVQAAIVGLTVIPDVRMGDAAVELAHEELCAQNGEDQPEEHRDQHDITERRDGADERIDHKLQPRTPIDEPQRPQDPYHFQKLQRTLATDESRHGRGNDDEVQHVPSVPQVRSLFQDESHRQDFDAHLAEEQQRENQIDGGKGHGQRRIGGHERVLHGQGHGADHNQQDHHVLKVVVGDHFAERAPHAGEEGDVHLVGKDAADLALFFLRGVGHSHRLPNPGVDFTHEFAFSI